MNSSTKKKILSYTLKQVRNPKTNEKLFKEQGYKLHFKIGKVLHNELNTLDHKVDE